MKRITALCLAAALLLFAGCGSSQTAAAGSEEAATKTILAMDTVMDLSVYGDESLLEDAADLITDLEGRLSVTDENSEIYAVNRDGSGRVSEDTAELLQTALELCGRTDGALDISIYPVVKAWGFTTGDYRVPSREELDSLLTHVDYTGVRISDDNSTVTLEEDMEIDLGSVTKGYTGDRVIALFREAGVTSALLNLGGNVQALGSKPDGSPWRVAVQNPLGSGVAGILEVTDRAVITSGGYERYFEEDGKTYWHIIDPATGAPADSGLVSVTVVGESGVTCDALSTALFVMGLEKASTFWRESSDFEAVLITSDGSVFITEGLEDTFTLYGDYADAPLEVIRRD